MGKIRIQALVDCSVHSILLPVGKNFQKGRMQQQRPLCAGLPEVLHFTAKNCFKSNRSS